MDHCCIVCRCAGISLLNWGCGFSLLHRLRCRFSLLDWGCGFSLLDWKCGFSLLGRGFGFSLLDRSDDGSLLDCRCGFSSQTGDVVSHC